MKTSEELTTYLHQTLKEYHDRMIEDTRTRANTVFDGIPKRIEKLYATCDKLYKSARTMQICTPQWKNTVSEAEGWTKQIDALQAIKRKGKETYIENEVNDAERRYVGAVNKLAVKLSALDIEGMELVCVSDDPKALDIRFSDTKTLVWCRSVMAAEYSDCVTPHWRYIITSRKLNKKARK